MRQIKELLIVGLVGLTVATQAVEIATDLTDRDLNATFGDAGISDGLKPLSAPVAADELPTFNFVYDISELGIGADTFEIFASVSISNLTTGTYGLAATAGHPSRWDVGEDFDFGISIKKGGVDVTSHYSVDLIGVALRMNNAGVESSIAGETVTSTGSGWHSAEFALASGQTNETAFSAVRSNTGIAQLGQLQFSVVNISPVPNYGAVIANFGMSSTLNSEGFSGGVIPASLPSETEPAANHTFIYDLADLGIVGAATLEVDVVSQTTSNLVSTPYGIAVAGGSDNWWDAGENLEIRARIYDPVGTDISHMYSFDLTGVSLRWVDHDSDSNAVTKVTGTIAGERFDAGSSIAISTYDLAFGEINERSFVATRTDANDVCQLGQIRLTLGAPADLPDTFAPLAEPSNLLFNNDFSQVTNATGPGYNNVLWNITGSNGDFPLYNDYADVVGWTHYHDDPNGMADLTDPGEVLDGTDKMDTLVNLNQGWIGLNSSWDYLNGMVAEDALNGVLYNPALDYIFSIDVRRHGSRDPSNTTFTAAITTGASSTDTNAIAAGSLIQISPVTSLTTDPVPYTAQFSGSELNGQVNVMFQTLNTEDFTAATSASNWPAVGSVDPTEGEEISEVYVHSVSLTFIPGLGDLDRDGFVTENDVALANQYLAGDGGDDAATRQAAVTALGFSDAAALAFLRLTAFDINGDHVFDADDVVALDGMILPLRVWPTMSRSSMGLSWYSKAGKVYDIESRTMLTSGGWEPYEGNTNITAELSGINSVTNFPVSDSVRFFRVIEK